MLYGFSQTASGIRGWRLTLAIHVMEIQYKCTCTYSSQECVHKNRRSIVFCILLDQWLIGMKVWQE